jgi:hypothetical protein
MYYIMNVEDRLFGLGQGSLADCPSLVMADRPSKREYNEKADWPIGQSSPVARTAFWVRIDGDH